MYSTAYNLWTFTWFVHFELPFSLKGTDKNHTERFSKFPSNIFSILFGYNRILLFLCLLLNSRVAPVVHFNFRAEIQSLCAWIYSLFVRLNTVHLCLNTVHLCLNTIHLCLNTVPLCLNTVPMCLNTYTEWS